MKSNEFQKILGNLTKEEFTEFGLYLKSPYFKVPKRFQALYDMIAGQKHSDLTTLPDSFLRLVSQLSSVNDITLSSKEINEKFYPGSLLESNQLNIRKLISDFRKYIDKYKAQSAFDKDMLTQRKMELNWLRKKNDLNGYIKRSGEAVEFIKNNFDKDEEYYLELVQLFSKIYEFRDSNLDEPENDFCFVINDYLDMYFLSMKLFLFQRMESLEYSAELDLTDLKTFEKEVYEYISTHKDDLKKSHPEIYLRYVSILLNKSGFDHTLYAEYINVLSKTETTMNINDYGLLLTLLNTISKFINSGSHDLEDKVLEVAELLINRNLVERKGIGHIDLKIIIEAAISLKKFDWALEYMRKVKDHIKYENPRNAYDMLSAKILFFKNDFKNARLLLSSITIDDYMFYCEAKLIEIRIVYLQSDYESFLQISDTVKKYIKSHKEIGKHFVEAYVYFIDFMKKLIDIQMKNHDDNEFDFKILLLKKEIDSINSPCYAYEWIKEQIVKLKAGH